MHLLRLKVLLVSSLLCCLSLFSFGFYCAVTVREATGAAREARGENYIQIHVRKEKRNKK